MGKDYVAPDKYFSNQYRTGQIKGQPVAEKTGILESVSMLQTFLIPWPRGWWGLEVKQFTELMVHHDSVVMIWLTILFLRVSIWLGSLKCKQKL